MNELVLKIADESDLPAMIKAGDSLFDYLIKLDRAKEFLQDPRHHLILAYFDEKLVGMVSAFDYVHPDKDPTLFINEASVLEDFQGQGIGRKLIKSMCEHAKSIGCKEAWVATEKSNMAARKAYVNAGGKEDAEDVVLIEFDLNS
ncbi:GNAT family N-acetyltransferase [Ekhidna sp.]|uniref:GNAT family N-acetyltransferase n=1 Tax=Ekhidna sp. TaxID=2608089 RepID=UPI003CCBF9C5